MEKIAVFSILVHAVGGLMEETAIFSIKLWKVCGRARIPGAVSSSVEKHY